MDFKVSSEEDMKELGSRLARSLTPPIQIELIGDVGVGKTTFTKGIALGLGIKSEVTSPSFTINRIYDADDGARLSHYDFYRLDNPGIIKNELDESSNDNNTFVVIEWAQSIEDSLDKDRIKVEISYCDDGSREVKLSGLKGEISS